MSGGDEDDKPTVVLDLNALKKKKEQQESDLANVASDLEFNIPDEIELSEASPEEDSEKFAENFLSHRPEATNELKPQARPQFPIILFDFQSDFFQKSLKQLPQGYNYKVVSTLPELNQCLKYKEFQLVIFNFDVNPKAINQLTAQIKTKMPHTKTMIMAKAISPEKAKLHASTPSGANGYYQFPLDASKFEKEIQKIHELKKVS